MDPALHFFPSSPALDSKFSQNSSTSSALFLRRLERVSDLTSDLTHKTRKSVAVLALVETVSVHSQGFL